MVEAAPPKPPPAPPPASAGTGVPSSAIENETAAAACTSAVLASKPPRAHVSNSPARRNPTAADEVQPWTQRLYGSTRPPRPHGTRLSNASEGHGRAQREAAIAPGFAGGMAFLPQRISTYRVTAGAPSVIQSLQRTVASLALRPGHVLQRRAAAGRRCQERFLAAFRASIPDRLASVQLGVYEQAFGRR